MLSYRVTGDALHVVNLLNISLYGSLLYLYGDRPGAVFDEEWLKDGFCLPHKDVHFRTTHDLSGYVMVVVAMIGLGAQQFLSRRTNNLAKADRLVFWAFMGALGHAAGHFLIANAKRRNFYPSNENETFLNDLLGGTLLEAIIKVGPGYPLFWIPLVKTYMMNTAQGRVALVALFFNIGALFVPVKFGFSYTQAVLFGGMSMDQLLLPQKEKGFEYTLWPLITTIPNGIFSWIESMGCTSSILMQRHGHIVYDLYMVSSYILFYVICWLRNNNRAKKKMP